jgi:hypothetical protein
MPASLLHENKYLVHTNTKYGGINAFGLSLPDIDTEHFCRVLVERYQNAIFPFYRSDWIDTQFLREAIKEVNQDAKENLATLSRLILWLGFPNNQHTDTKHFTFDDMVYKLMNYIIVDPTHGFTFSPTAPPQDCCPDNHFVPKFVEGGDDMNFYWEYNKPDAQWSRRWPFPRSSLLRRSH